ncbi:UDP-glycosyltransferase UGT5-like isoform X1 [Coccinella septempunctata]|uniref:UDP-glycosyltransferase UGT5-like isoform X1 n=1 Tax=Coccinella septempunctata TaxID=41139 RepID=UPI001D064BCA|nr:UDP-glycosyltransferase UGT5-like isoform X1 [Coccinella septempunctata]
MKFVNMIELRVVFVLLYCVVSSYSYNILAVFPHEGKSHQWIFGPIIRELVKKGHSVTALVHYKFDLKSERYNEIILHDPDARGLEVFGLDDLEVSLWYAQIRSSDLLLNEGLQSCEVMFSNSHVKKLLKSNVKFDLIFGELFNSECTQGFALRFKAPLVAISTTMIMAWHNGHFGNPDNPSYIPNNHIWFSDRMSFSERMVNFLATTYAKVVYGAFFDSNRRLLEEHLQMQIPDLDALTRNTSLLLVNSHWSLTFTRPLVPSVVEIGGVHIQKNKPLPKNIEKFINESTHGVIYFSLGSMIKGHTFPQEKREAFLKAFARLPQRVLWKWENETMPGKPDNVMIQKWMPQFDILSHPNVKAFISHGGLLGTTEAVHCGVPMVVMPQYGDQHTNAKAVEANGGGVVLYLKEATEETVYQSLKTILEPEFRAKAKALSERFRDRPMSPMDTAIYWVEYVARHKGAPHMKTAAVDMPLYQYLLLDVLAFLAAIILLFSYISYKILSLVFRSVFAKKKVKQN